MSIYYRLREVEETDHQWLVDLHNDPLVLRNITNPNPITLKSHLKWWNSLNQKINPRKIFCVNDMRVGFVKFYNIDYLNSNCLLGADIEKSYRGKGYASPMWKLMLEYCFKELKLYRVGLTTAEYNIIGQKVYQKLGFIKEGKIKKSLFRDNQYYDQISMYMTSKEYFGIHK